MGSWDIAPRYSTDVLIGNWNEERHRYKKNRFVHPSLYSLDYVPKQGDPSDVIVRYKAVVRNCGLSKQALLGHHGHAHDQHLITMYDQDFNARPRVGPNTLPPLRTWDSGRLAWIPEKSDHPIVGESTQFGLLNKKQQEWNSGGQVYRTSYASAFVPHPVNTLLAARYQPFLNRAQTSKPEMDSILRGGQ